MGGLRGGRGGGGGGGFEDNESFDAIDDARSDNEGCELFLGGGGGGGDESVGCCVVASIFPCCACCDELCRAARCTATPCCQRASALSCSLGSVSGLRDWHTVRSSRAVGLLCSDQCVSAALVARGRRFANFLASGL